MEALDARGDTHGEERLAALVGDIPLDAPARETADRIVGAVKAFLGEAVPADDMTLMVVRGLR